VLFKYRFGGGGRCWELQAGRILARAHFNFHRLGLQNSAYGAETNRDKPRNKIPCPVKCRKYTECLSERPHDLKKKTWGLQSYIAFLNTIIETPEESQLLKCNLILNGKFEWKKN
jgi:hypothetical protein